MKRIGNIYKEICSFENLEKAYRKAIIGKRYKGQTMRFTANKENELDQIKRELEAMTYKQSPFHFRTIYEPKKRQIASLPIRDRIVQHAICNVIDPIIDKRLFFHSYACRKNKGMHKASDQLTTWIRETGRGGRKVYALKGDISHYFQSIDHAILKKLYREIFKDEKALTLIEAIIDSTKSDCGIPIGSLMSQLSANLVLNELDLYVKNDLRERRYMRYMDDFLIISDDLQHLRETETKIENFLRDKLALNLNPKTGIICADNGINFCGYRHYIDHKTIRRRSMVNFRKVIKAWEKGIITDDKFDRSIASWCGHTRHADSFRLRMRAWEKIESARIWKRPETLSEL